MTTTAQPAGPARRARRMWRVIARHPAITAGAAFLVGVPATAVGGGVAARDLSTLGATGPALVALALLVVGLGLLGFAAVTAWRALRRWRRLWLVPIVIATALVISSIAIGAMLAYAPRNSLGSATPADRGLAYVDVTFPTTDGVRLSAWYLPSHNSAAVVTVPGSGSNRSGTLQQAAVLARHGFGVLMIDPRGQGRSGGQAMDAGWWGDRDVSAAVTFLQHRRDVDPHRIGVLGLSMGGEEAIGAAAHDRAIRAVVAEGATNRTAADKAGWLPGGITGAIQRVLDRITYGTAAVLSSAPEPQPLHSAIAQARDTRFLLIAGGDVIDEPEATAYLRTAAPDRVRTWTVAGASHTGGLTTAPGQWVRRVIGFLHASLGR